MLIEIYFTKVTKAIFPNSVLTSIISHSLPMQPTNLSRLQIQYGVSTGNTKSLLFIFFIKKNYFRPFGGPN